MDHQEILEEIKTEQKEEQRQKVKRILKFLLEDKQQKEKVYTESQIAMAKARFTFDKALNMSAEDLIKKHIFRDIDYGYR